MKNKWEETSHPHDRPHSLAALDFERLIRLKDDDEREAFNKLIQTLLPDVEGYIVEKLRGFMRKGQIPAEKYKVEEFVSELYILAFEHIKEIHDERDLPYWLFQKADELLENALIEEGFKETFMENIDKYSRAEWDAMQEDFNTTDEDGTLLASELFDDPSYPKYEYRFEDVFVEYPELGWSKRLNEEIGNSKIHEHVDMVLDKLPVPIRSVYDLAVNQGFSPHEIAKIKHHSIQRVETFLAKAREIIGLTIKHRFLKNGPQ